MRKSYRGTKAASGRREIQAYARHALAANGFGDAPFVNAEQRTKSAGARPGDRTRPTALAAAPDAFPIAQIPSTLQRRATPWKQPF